MELLHFSREATESYGALIKNQVVCLPLLAEITGQVFPSNIEAFISRGLSTNAIESLMKNSTKTEIRKSTVSLDQIKLLKPLAKPPKIICLGLNYVDHAEEQGKKPPEEPVIFMKPHTALIGPDEEIVKPDFVKQLDYEGELAIVMGKKAKNLSTEKSKSHIFGYTILNDVSARDVQFKDKQWTRGKSFDTFAPIGPCITFANQITNPANLTIQTWINEELRQNSNTANMALNVFEVVSQLSRVMTLEPCDIIATGTPAGVGFAIKPSPKFLQPGDLVKIRIDKIGVLRNKVVEEKPTD